MGQITPMASGATDVPDAPQSTLTDSSVAVPPGIPVPGAVNGPVAIPPGTPVSQAPSPGTAAAAQAPSLGQQARSIVSDFTQGVGEGALKTVNTISKGLNKIPGVGETLAPSQGIAALSKIATPENTTQSVGFGAEALLEMMATDGVLGKMSLAERLGLGEKIATLAEKHPFIAKVLSHGLNSIRMGSAQAAENVAKGQPVSDAVTAGAETAAAGTAAGTAAEGMRYVFNPTTGKAVQLGRQLVKGSGMAQAPAQEALATAAGTTPGGSVREMLTGPINKLLNTAKSGYKAIEDATGVDPKVLQQKLDNTVDEINKLTGTEVDIAKEAQLEKARTELIDQINDMKQQAQAKGVSLDTMDKADAAYKKAKALSEVHASVFDGNVIKGNLAHGTPETINVDSAIANLEKLNNKVKYGAPRLQQAFGPEGADRLLKEMYAAQREGVKAMSRQKWASIVGRAVGFGALARIGYKSIEAIGSAAQ